MDWGEFWEQAAQWAIIWIPVLGPLGILTTAVVAYVAYRQKLEADRRAQWWVRTQWALEASLSANPRRALAGLAVLNDLRTSSLATREDRALFRLIGLTVQEEVLGEAEDPVGAPSVREPKTGPVPVGAYGLVRPEAAGQPPSQTQHVSSDSRVTVQILEQVKRLLAPDVRESQISETSSAPDRTDLA